MLTRIESLFWKPFALLPLYRKTELHLPSLSLYLCVFKFKRKEKDWIFRVNYLVNRHKFYKRWKLLYIVIDVYDIYLCPNKNNQLLFMSILFDSAMFEAIFSILRIGKSLELTMESFRLLNELDKRFPRIYSSDVDNSTSSSSVPELIVVEEAWYPFASSENASNERGATNNSGGPVDSSGFQLLIQDLADATDEANFQASETKTLANMLLFQYLINVLEWDFLPRNRIYKETMNWVVLRESLINMLLVSRKVNQKSLTKDCLTIMCNLYQTHAGFTDDLTCSKKSVAQPAEKFDAAAAIALLEIGNNTCIAMQKFLVIIMELDVSKQSADIQGSTTRADGIRSPLLEIILEELTYNKDILDPFLQVFDEPKWKLEIVVKYLWKYIAKPSIRTRRSNGPPDDDASFNGALKCFSNITSAKSTIKKIRTEVVQLLLAHGFQAHLSLPCENLLVGDTSTSDGETSSGLLVEICENIISAFKNMKAADKRMEVLSLGKEALFTAATIVSAKSQYVTGQLQIAIGESLTRTEERA